MSEIMAERDSDNEASIEEAPPVMPSEIASLSHRDFMKDVLDPLRIRLKNSGWTDIDIDIAEQDHHNFRNAYRNEPLLRSRIDKQTVSTGFNETWAAVGDRFMNLREVLAGLASVFHNSTSVEGDFSITKWERDPTRLSLANLSLEGIVQSKQSHLLRSIPAEAE
jgi:hypothetical protein